MANPGIVKANAEQLREYAMNNCVSHGAPASHYCTVANIIGMLGSAPCESLAAHVNDDSKRVLCETFAIIVGKGSARAQFRKTGKMRQFELEAFDSVTPWWAQKFVSLGRPMALKHHAYGGWL